MAANTKIEWTDRTWNPVRGCSMAKGSESGGCLNCYAARMAARNLPEMKSPATGQSFARILESGPRWTGELELIEKSLPLPLKWRAPNRIFVNSMSDLFHEALPDSAIDPVFAVMAACPQHTFQVLTKRPERMLPYIRNRGSILPNLWLGASVENQATADMRIPLLLQTPAAVRFVSYEPALAPVDFTRLIGGLDWIIVGGESGPGARPFDPSWALSVIAQCAAVETACFVKQLGAKPVALSLRDRKGGDWTEWPERLRVRQFPLGTRLASTLGMSEEFAFPKERKEPIHDAAHVRNAVARFNQVKGVSDSERDAAWKRIRAAARKFDVELNESDWRELK